jgi:hypothetical protein
MVAAMLSMKKTLSKSLSHYDALWRLCVLIM